MISSLGTATPRIDPGCFVAATATVLGDVEIGAESSVWFGAVVRGDINAIRIGRRTNVQDLCTLHVDAGYDLLIGDEVTIGHRAIVHGCHVGDRVLVGMGAILMNGARVGEECIIGAGAVVTEHAEIPRHSLVLGIPGKVVRTLAAEEVRGIRESADVYAKGAARYRTTELAHDLGNW
jgi:carbonic anhydrase/acetyltransferase-like protein (isoleucine patch superfamily)